MASVQEKIAGLYAAFFNRAPDVNGMNYWLGEADRYTQEGQTPQQALDTLAAAFAGHPVFTSTYGGMDDTDFVTAIYQNMLGSDPDAGGLAYYTGKLGDTSLDYSRSDMVAEFIGGVLDVDLNDPAFDGLSPEDRSAAENRQQLMQNKVAVSLDFIDELSTRTNVTQTDINLVETDPAYLASIKILSGVTVDATTVTTAQNSIDLIKSRSDAITVLNAIETLNEDDLTQYLNANKDNGSTIEFTGDEDSKIGISDMRVSAATQESSNVISLSDFRNSESFGDITGSGYAVVILDTGIDLNHSFFGDDLDRNGIADRIVYTRDFTNDGDGTVDDVNGHGTNVASIAASSSSVYTGMAPDANIIALQVLGNDGSGSFAWIESALQWVVNNAQTYNIAAINMSLGDGSNANTHAITSISDELAALDRLGVINVAASGNSYYDYQTEGASNPAIDANMISVGATFDASYGDIRWYSGARAYSAVTDDITPFSQRSSDVVDIFAPGAFITGAAPGGSVSSMTGTSQAAPHIAGIAVLAQQLAEETLGRRLSNDEFSSLLQQSGVVIVDGDGENDNVVNTGESYYRVDMNALGEAILAMADGEETPNETIIPDTDIEQTMATKGLLTLDETLSGTIDFGGDKDWFKIALVARAEYQFELNSDVASQNALSDPYLEIYSTTGEFIASNDDGTQGLNASLNFIPSISGNYYISARAYGSSMTGDYTLRATQVQAVVVDDYAADNGTFGSIEAGTPETGHIELANDQDWFAITMTTGNVYTIDLSATTLSDPYIAGLYDATGTLISGTTNDNGGEGYNARVVYQPMATGTYFIAASGNASATGTYTVSVTEEESPDDYLSTTATLGTLSVDASASGSIEQMYDTDWFAMQLETSHEYTIDMTGVTLPDTYIRGIYDAQGVLIHGTSNDDAGGTLNSQVHFTPTYEGTYYLSAGGYGSRTGTYTLALSAQEAIVDDYLDTLDTTGALSLSAPATGNIETAYDIDWFEVSLDDGYTYTIDMTRNGLSDAQIYGLYDASGSYIYGTYNNGGTANSNASIAYTPLTNGTYYLAASGYADATGTYGISMSRIHADDYSDDIYTAGLIRANSRTSGEIEVAGDSDWFATTLRAGYEYTFDATNVGTVSGIYNSNGSLILSNSIEQLLYAPTTTGTYYISVSNTTTTGAYSLYSTEMHTADDYAASTATVGYLTSGSSNTGSIEQAYDTDWFAVYLSANTEYIIDLEGSATSQGTLSDTYLRGIYDIYGNLFSGTYDDDSGTGLNSQLSFTPSTSATYYISAGAYGSGTGTYRLSVDAGTARTPDIGSTIYDHGNISTGTSFEGISDFSYDQDWYGVWLNANTTYTINVTSADTSAYLYMYDENGNYLSYYNGVEYTYGYGYDASLSFTPQSSGLYFVDVYGYGEGTYTLSMDSGTAKVDDYAASTATSGRISIGSYATGSIEQAYDTDWFAISLAANTRYVIDLEGSATSRGTLGDTYIRGVYDASGNLINATYDDDSGTGLNSQLSFTATQAGTYYINAGAYGTGIGTYRLSVGSGIAVTPDIGSSLYDHGTMSVGSSVNGTVNTYYDSDWYAINLTAGYAYEMSIDSSDAQTYLYLRDAQGNSLYYGSDGVTYNYNTTHDASLTFTPSTSGTYYVDAYGYDEGSYTLNVDYGTAATPDVGQTIYNHGTATVGSSVEGNVNFYYDEDWYAIDLVAGYEYEILGYSDEASVSLYLVDSSGSYLSSGVEYLYRSGYDASIAFTPSTSGTYYIDAYGYSSSGAYTISIGNGTEVIPDIGQTIYNHGTISAGTSVESLFENYSDIDWFAIDLSAGYEYTITANAPNGSAYLSMVDSAGSYLYSGVEYLYNTGYDAAITFTPSTSGTYYIASYGYNYSSSGTTYDYTLSVGNAQAIEIPSGSNEGEIGQSVSSHGTISIGETISNTIDTYSDLDWFAITLTAGHRYQIDQKGADTGVGTLEDPELYLYNNIGSGYLAYNDDSSYYGLDAQITYDVTVTGTYFIQAGSWDAGTGTYALSVVEIA